MVTYQIPDLHKYVQNASGQVCATCPLSIFTKLSYSLNFNHATNSNQLNHLDTWGPYKICTRDKNKYFFDI